MCQLHVLFRDGPGERGALAFAHGGRGFMGRTGVDFAAKAENSLAYTGPYYRAVLFFVADDLVYTAFDKVSGHFAPRFR